MTTQMRSLLLSLIATALVPVACLTTTGCKSMENEKFWNNAQKLTEFARANDMAGALQISIDGDGSVYQKVAFGLNTGLSAKASFQFNAGDAESAVNPVTNPGKVEDRDDVSPPN